MKTSTAYSFTAALVMLAVSVHAQSWQWAEKLGADWNMGTNINTDAQENLLVSGVTGAAAFSNIDAYFAKLDSNGAFIWDVTYGGSGNDYAQEIITDSLGNYYLLGAFEGSIVIGSVTLISNGSKDMFLAKLDANLNVLWAKKGGGTGNDEPFSIRVDNSGNCYVITPFQINAQFDAISFVSAGGFDIALVKYDSNGNVVWAKQAGGVDTDIPFSMSLDSNGNIIIGGHFAASCTFDTNTITSLGDWDVFIAKYDPAGTVLWATSFGGPSSDGNTIVRVGSDDNIYLAGVYTTSIDFGTVQLTSAGGLFDLFVAKFDPVSGNIIWAKQAGSTYVDVTYNMTIDKYCNMYFTGYYGSTAQFGSISVTGSWDVYVTKYDSSGTAQWVKTTNGLGGQHSYEGWGIAERNDNIYVTGLFTNDMYFDNSPLMLTSSGMFVAKITQTTTGINEVEIPGVLNIYPNPCSTCNLLTEYSSESFLLTDIIGRVIPVKFQKTINGYSFKLPEGGNMFFLTHIDSGKTIRIVSE